MYVYANIYNSSIFHMYMHMYVCTCVHVYSTWFALLDHGKQPMRFVEVLFHLILIIDSHLCCRLLFQLLRPLPAASGMIVFVNVVDTNDLYTSLEELMRQFAGLHAAVRIGTCLSVIHLSLIIWFH